MKNNHTDITIVLDRSGSMAQVANDTIGGFNRFLEDQQAAPGTADLSLHQFNTEFETLVDGKDVKSAPKLTSKTFVPLGSTALLDAIGRAIIGTGARLESRPDDQRAEKVVFVILTDGLENASHRFRREKINEMISHQREKYGWEFVFLGANQDAISVGESIGVAVGASMTYVANQEGTQEVYRSFSHNLTSLRSGRVQTMDFSEDDRAKQRKAGAK